MIRAGSLAVALSIAALWAVPYLPAAVNVAGRPLSAGLLVVGIVLLLLATERACPACTARVVRAERELADRHAQAPDVELQAEDAHADLTHEDAGRHRVPPYIDDATPATSPLPIVG